MSTSSRIPAGRNHVIPHLIIKGANQAIEFYKQAFGAVELCRLPGPDGYLVMHAELLLGDSPIYLCDEFPAEMNCGKSPLGLPNSPVALHLYVEDADTAFDRAVKAGATVTMPLMNMFWGDRYGKLRDPFGHEWSIASHLEDVTPAEMTRRMSEMFPPKP